MTALHYREIGELPALFAAGETSPLALTRAMLDRIEALEPRLHSYALVLRESALAEAAAAEARLKAGRALGPLDGVPLAVKDLCDVAGRPTQAGMPLRAGHVAQEDATVVARLRAQGAVILGKLQLSEGAFATHHPDIVPPANPWSAAHWPGVSSSGSGVAVAAGLCFGALGTDTGGSIRFPSTMNNLTGLKPTWGRVSRHGVFPLSPSFDHVGPMARSARDAALILAAIAGPDPRDPTTLADALPLPDLEGDALAGARVAVDWAWSETGTEEPVLRAFRAALGQLERLGAVIVEAAIPDPAAVIADSQIAMGVETAIAHADLYPAQAQRYGPALTHLLEIGHATGGTTLQRAIDGRARFRHDLEAFLAQVDFLAVPVIPFAPPSLARLDELATDMDLDRRLTRFTIPFDASLHPTITLPCGRCDEGMPIGFQLVARHGAEAALCAAGAAFQRASDWHRAHPPC